ncbi:MAG: hypothetical protein COC03_00920 [Robiginitomaculum sp.]|nr:MAG: hypothetical protein COC03_00920 [Robiginitomaculum sp.]
MRIKFIIIIMSLIVTTMFSVQIVVAHPQQLHEVKKEQTQPQQHDDEGTASHEHSEDGEKTMASHDEAGEHDEAGGEAGGHSHWGISPNSSPFSKLMASFGKFHPLIVHFPIALFLTAAFAQVLNLRTKNGAYDKTVSLLVWLAAFGALGAGLLGWAHSGPVQAGENVVMSSHRWIGTSLLIGGLITAYLMTNAKKIDGGLRSNKAFNLFLFSMALAVAVNGFLGGALAHGGIKHLMPGMM